MNDLKFTCKQKTTRYTVVTVIRNISIIVMRKHCITMIKMIVVKILVMFAMI